MDRLNLEWFHALERREQWMVLTGGVALGLYLFFILLWRPLSAENASLQERNAKAIKTLQWMRNSAAFIQQQKKSSTSNRASNQSLSQLLNDSVTSNGLRFSRFQPRGNDKAQVWFENASFSAVFLWLQELSNQNVVVSNVSVSSTAQGGVVSASMQLQKM
ncbi:MAG: type II secretion system protein M [Pseudomonadota bacterium]